LSPNIDDNNDNNDNYKSQKSINPYERIDENFANNPIDIDNNDYNNDNNNKTLIIMIIWIMKY